MDWEIESSEITVPEPVAPQVASDVAALQEASTAIDGEAAARHFSTVFARLAAEAWVAATTTAETSREEKLAYVHRRVQNAWLLQVWFAFDRTLPDSPTSNQLALYLTLGFTQATTTWRWPATERWIALLGGNSPEDWLPRSQWHLCWLLHAPEDEVHRRGLDEALDEGLEDDERPGVARELRKLIPKKK